MKIGIVSGYFNPIHKGHIYLIQRAKEVVDSLVVIVNSDLQRELKGSREFMTEQERCFIMANIKGVNAVFLSIDEDRSVSKSIEHVVTTFRELFPGEQMDFYFINGGDRHNSEIPETAVCKEYGVEVLDGFGSKVQSSSELLSKLIKDNESLR